MCLWKRYIIASFDVVDSGIKQNQRFKKELLSCPLLAAACCTIGTYNLDGNWHSGTQLGFITLGLLLFGKAVSHIAMLLILFFIRVSLQWVHGNKCRRLARGSDAARRICNVSNRRHYTNWKIIRAQNVSYHSSRTIPYITGR